MKVELAYLRRMKYGRSSERLEHPQPQLELVGGQAAQLTVAPSLQGEFDDVDALKSNVTSLETQRKKRQPKPRPGLRETSEHLARRTADHTPLQRLCQIYGRDGVDTPIRSLGGKGKKARTGRLWVCVRADRPGGDKAAPAGVVPIHVRPQG